MADETLPSLEQLREKAKEFRAVGEGYLRRAEEIDSTIDILISLASGEVIAVETKAAARPSKPEGAAVAGGRKGKQPGTLTNRWKGFLANIVREADKRPFSTETVQRIVKQSGGREMRRSEIQRQFEPYVEAGILVQPDKDSYQITDAGIEKIGIVKNSESPPMGVGELPVGGVAERSIAADSESAGDTAFTPSAPEGSNPSTSAPFRRDLLTAASASPFVATPSPTRHG